jgi:putative nucleotide binding protein
MAAGLEEYGWVVDFLPEGRSSERSSGPLAQLVGEQFFTLFEVSIKPSASLNFGQRVYIGKEQRDEVDRIKRRIDFSELTASSKSELSSVLKKIILQRQDHFINFFNKAGPLSVRLHQLELISGIGKKHLNQILEAREQKPFDNFDDMKKRVPLLPDPAQIVVGRISEELEGNQQHYLFVRPPKKENRY